MKEISILDYYLLLLLSIPTAMYIGAKVGKFIGILVASSYIYFKGRYVYVLNDDNRYESRYMKGWPAVMAVHSSVTQDRLESQMEELLKKHKKAEYFYEK